MQYWNRWRRAELLSTEKLLLAKIERTADEEWEIEMRSSEELFRCTLTHKINLITDFVRSQLGAGEGQLCSEDGNFNQNSFLWKEKGFDSWTVETLADSRHLSVH